MEAQIAKAVLPLENSAVGDKVHTFAFACLKDNHLRLGEVDCELALLTEEALQGSSAYSSKDIGALKRCGASLPGVSRKCFYKPTRHSPNSVGHNGYPCLTLRRHLKMP